MDRSRVAPLAALDGITDAELDAIARVAWEREFADGETLMTEGDFGHSLFLIETGSAEVQSDGAKVADVGPGAIVGEVAVLASGRRTATVVATSPVRVIALFKRDVWALEKDAPETARRLRAAIELHAKPAADASSGE